MPGIINIPQVNVSEPSGLAATDKRDDPQQSHPIMNSTASGNTAMASKGTASNFNGFLPGGDGYNQTIKLLFPNGSPFNISMTDLTSMNSVNIGMGLTYGTQIGLAFLMLVVTILLTQKGKRRSLIFVCNVLALALDIPCSALSATWLASMWNNPYVYFTHDTSHITKANIVASIIPQPFKFLEILAIQLSLITQVRVVLLTTPAFLRRCILAVLFTLCFINMGMYIALSIINARQIARLADPLPIQPQLAQAANTVFCIFVTCAMLVFIWKLAYALKNRRNLGLVKFGPMQVIFIMGVQTMVGPTTLSILNLVLTVDIAGLVITITAVTLPLSGLWAATALEPAGTTPNPNNQIRAKAFELPLKFSDSGLTASTNSESELMDIGSFLSSSSSSGKKENAFEV